MPPIQRNNSSNVSTQVREDLQRRIREGEFVPDAKLTSERQLALDYGVSRLSVRQAITELVQQGLLYRIPTKGTFVRKLNASERLPQYTQPCIGVVLGGPLKESFFAGLIAPLAKAFAQRGYGMLLRCCDEDPYLEHEYVRELVEHHACALMVVAGSCSLSNLELYRDISRQLPVAVVNTFLEGATADYVGSDEVKGACEAVTHLIELGHRRILHLAGPRENSTGRLRLRGYREALQASGIALDDRLVRQCGWNRESGYHQMKKFLLTNDRIATAVFCCSDNVAVGALDALTERGLKMPEDVSVVGYGDLDITRQLHVPLTTVDQHPATMATEAVSLLVERVEGRRALADVRQVSVPTELIIRASCGINMKPDRLARRSA